MSQKEAWNRIMHSGEIWAEPKDFSEMLMQHADRCLILVLGIIVAIVYIAVVQLYRYEERRDADEAKLDEERWLLDWKQRQQKEANRA